MAGPFAVLGGVEIGATVINEVNKKFDPNWENDGSSNVVTDGINGIIGMADNWYKFSDTAIDGMKISMKTLPGPFRSLGETLVGAFETNQNITRGIQEFALMDPLDSAQKVWTHSDNETREQARYDAKLSGDTMKQFATDPLGALSTGVMNMVSGVSDGQARLNQLYEIGAIGMQDSWGYTAEGLSCVPESERQSFAQEGAVWDLYAHNAGFEGLDGEELSAHHDYFVEAYNELDENTRLSMVAEGLSYREQMAAISGQQSQQSEGQSWLSRFMSSETVTRAAGALGLSNELENARNVAAEARNNINGLTDAARSINETYIDSNGVECKIAEIEAPIEMMNNNQYDMEFE